MLSSTVATLLSLFGLSLSLSSFAAAGDPAAQYDVDTGVSAMYFAQAAHCELADIQSWTCPSCAMHPAMESVSTFYNKSLESQAFTGYDPTTGSIVVATRGSADTVNWLADFDFVLYNYSSAVPACQLPPNATTHSSTTSCMVHVGFFATYVSLIEDGLRDSVLKLLDTYEGKVERIFVMGHSLGAAVSYLLAVDLLLNLPTSRPPLLTYTFGCPRLANDVFIQWAEQLMLPHDVTMQQNYHYRVTHHQDPVPHLPPEWMLDYLHFPHEIHFPNDTNNTYVTCVDSATQEDTSKLCARGEIADNPNDHNLYLGIRSECPASPSPTPSSLLWSSQQ